MMIVDSGLLFWPPCTVQHYCRRLTLMHSTPILLHCVQFYSHCKSR